MAFDYTNFLEVDATIEADFIFTDKNGIVDQPLAVRNTQLQWCLETTGSTTSTGTGATANPVGRSAYIYTESSETGTPASSLWAMRRDAVFDASTQDIFLDLILNLNAAVESNVLIEYATVAAPNETTDWTILETIPCTLIDAWAGDTFDFSAQTTTTLRIRVRCDESAAFTNDICFSTWREYSVDTNLPIGITTDSDVTANAVNEVDVNGTAAGITAIALDPDVGDTITYTLFDDAGGRFAIGSSSGIVTIADASQIVFATNTSHSITIRSTSSDTTFSDLTTTIQVGQDPATPQPIGDITDTNASANSVSEEAANGATVGITAFADDANPADTVSYSLDDNAGGRFAIDSVTGIVTVLDASLIVFATSSSHNITVKATSTDATTSTLIFTIAVTQPPQAILKKSLKFDKVISPKMTFNKTKPGEGVTLEGETHIIDFVGDIKDNQFIGDLHIAAGVDAVILYDNSSVTGLVYNDSPSNTLTINAVNGSNLSTNEPGTGNGLVNIVNSVVITITVTDEDTGLPLPDARVILVLTSDYSTQVINGNSNASGVVTSTYNYISDVNVVGWARQMDIIGTDYTPKDISGTVTSSGLSLTVQLKPI